MARPKLARAVSSAWKRSAANKAILLIAAVFLILFLAVLITNADVIAAAGVLGVILCVVVFCAVCGPALLILLGVWAGVGAVQTGADQVKSCRESAKSPQMKALEKKRIQLQLVTLACAAVGIAGLFTLPWLTLAAIVGYVLTGLPMRLRYNSEFKEQVVRTGLEELLDNVDYRPDECMPSIEVIGTGIFDRADSVNGNDLITADHGRIHFTQSDVFLETNAGYTTMEENGQTVTVPRTKRLFGGRLMRFDFPQPFAAPVQVLNKGFRHAAHSPSLLKTLSGKASVPALETELDSFNRRFNVFAEDAAKALEVLNPQMIDGINRLGEQIEEPMAFSFIENHMYVAIDMGGADSFEARTGGVTTLSQQRDAVRKELALILTFLEQVYVKTES